MKFDIGDVINYKFDDGESVGVIGEFDEEDLEYKFFTQDGDLYSFRLNDRDDMNRVVFLGKNAFSI